MTYNAVSYTHLDVYKRQIQTSVIVILEWRISISRNQVADITFCLGVYRGGDLIEYL